MKKLRNVWVGFVLILITIFLPANLLFSAEIGVWYQYNGNEYALVYQDVGGSLGGVWGYWHTLEAIAVSDHGAHLVTINDAAEQDFLFSFFGYNTWIGLHNYDEGTYPYSVTGWHWASGESPSYSNWSGGSVPDITYAAGARIDSDGKWQAFGYQGASTTGIMERPSTVPVPGSMFLLSSGLAGLFFLKRRSKKRN